MSRLIAAATRLCGLDEDVETAFVLHPGGRGASGFVSLFIYHRGEPVCIAKVSRTNDGSLEQEAVRLGEVASALADSTLLDTIDRAIGTESVDGRTVLFKRFGDGRPAARTLLVGDRSAALNVLRESCTWLLRFIGDTSHHRIHDPGTKREAALSIVRSDLDHSWLDVFTTSERQFLGPAHGDLVPANILLHEGRVTTVVDFENFRMDGFPIADFVGIIVSIATKLFGTDDEMMAQSFGRPGWFCDEVAAQVGRYCELVGCDLEEFVRLLPLYSDRAFSIAELWEMRDGAEFHDRLRAFFIGNQELVLRVMARARTFPPPLLR